MIHIGQKIQERLNGLGISKTEFARKINTSRENVYGIFERESIDTTLLKKISVALEHDFFQYFREGMEGLEDSFTTTGASPEHLKLLEEKEKLQRQLEKDARELIESKNDLIRILKEKIARLESELASYKNSDKISS